MSSTSTITFKKPYKPFSELSNSYQNIIINKINDLFILLQDNNNDKVFINKICNSKLGKTFFFPYYYENNFKPILTNIKNLYNNTSSDSHKQTVLSLTSNQFSFKELKEIGFNISNIKDNKYYLSKKINKNSTATLNPYTRIMPLSNLPLEKNTITEIVNILIYYSSEPYGIIKKKSPFLTFEIDNYKVDQKYFLNLKIKTIFTHFKKKHPNIKISQSTFYKYIPINFFYRKKRTDMCHICINKEIIFQQIKHLNENKKQIPTSLQSKYTTLLKHLNIIDNQKIEYKKNQDNLTEKDCMLVLDFKENLRIGGGPNETKKIYLNKKQISVFGISIITKKNSFLVKNYHTFFSNQLKHDSKFSGTCFSEFFKQQNLQNFENITIWTDGGCHFRSQELLYTFHQLSENIKGIFKHNYFGEYHGKNIVDGHFGKLSQTFEEIESSTKIQNINHLKILYEQKENERINNNLDKANNIDFGKNYFHIYKSPKRDFINQLCIKNIKDYLSFVFFKNELFVSLTTSQNSDKYDYISFKFKQIDDNREDKFTPEDLNIDQTYDEASNISNSEEEQPISMYQKTLKRRYDNLDRDFIQSQNIKYLKR